MEVLNSILVMGAAWFFIHMHVVTWRLFGPDYQSETYKHGH